MSTKTFTSSFEAFPAGSSPAVWFSTSVLEIPTFTFTTADQNRYRRALTTDPETGVRFAEIRFAALARRIFTSLILDAASSADAVESSLAVALGGLSGGDLTMAELDLITIHTAPVEAVVPLPSKLVVQPAYDATAYGLACVESIRGFETEADLFMNSMN